MLRMCKKSTDSVNKESSLKDQRTLRRIILVSIVCVLFVCHALLRFFNLYSVNIHKENTLCKCIYRKPLTIIVQYPSSFILSVGVCVSITSSFCAGFSNWSTTTFPNILGHRSPAEVAAAESAHEDLFVTSCGRDFWCAVFNPPCFRNKALPPCRKYCKSKYVA